MTPTPRLGRVPVRRHPIARAAARRTVVITVAVGVLLLASSAQAFAVVPVTNGPVAANLNEVLNNVRNWIMGILGSLATVFLSLGGVRYMLGNGDPGEINKAREAFRNAGYGYGLAALAPVVVEILKQIFGG